MGRNLLLLLAATALALLLGEGLLRLVYRDLPVESWARSGFCKDADDLRIMRPGGTVVQLGEWGGVTHAANDRGYRDASWDAKRGPQRVLILGDSFGFGWGVPADSTIVSRIDAIEGVDAYNLSIPGDGPVRMYHRYLRHRAAIDPDLVVVLAYVNDLHGPAAQAERLAGLRRTRPTPATGPERCRRLYEANARDYRDRSYLYRLANQVRTQGGISFSSAERQRAALRVGFAADAKMMTVPGEIEQGVAIFREILAEIARDQPVVLASVPPAYRIDGAWRKRVAGVYPDLAGADLEGLDRALAGAAAELGIPFVPLADTLETIAAAGRSPYFVGDGHLNPFGQIAAGRQLAAHVAEILRPAAPPRTESEEEESARVQAR